MTLEENKFTKRKSQKLFGLLVFTALLFVGLMGLLESQTQSISRLYAYVTAALVDSGDVTLNSPQEDENLTVTISPTPSTSVGTLPVVLWH